MIATSICYLCYRQVCRLDHGYLNSICAIYEDLYLFEIISILGGKELRKWASRRESVKVNRMRVKKCGEIPFSRLPKMAAADVLKGNLVKWLSNSSWNSVFSKG